MTRTLSGYVPESGWMTVGSGCWNCNSQGKLEEEPCTVCNGTGTITGAVSLRVFMDYIEEEMKRRIRRDLGR